MRYSAASITVASQSNHTGHLTLVPGKGPITVRATTSICAYGRAEPLPAGLRGATPDIVIPG